MRTLLLILALATILSTSTKWSAASAAPLPPAAHANDPPHIWRWWATHIKGFRPDRSRRWDPRGAVQGEPVEALPQLVEEAKAQPLPPPEGLPPVRERLPEVPPATPSPLPTPPWP